MLEIPTEARDSFYYRDYCYAANFYLPHAPALRSLSHNSINNYVSYRAGAHFTWLKSVDNESIQKLRTVCDLFLGFKEPCKRLIYSNHVYFYTNCLEDLGSMANHPDVGDFRATKADVCLPAGVVLLKEPKHKYRTYLKERWIPEGQTPVLRKFLLSRENLYSFTPTFKKRLIDWDRFYTRSHFFIDHDDPRDLLMLEMVVPGLIRKTMPIQAK